MMLLKFINSNRLSVIVFISLLPVVMWIPSLLPGSSVLIAEPGGVPLGRLIMAFNKNFRLIASLIALLIIVGNGYLLIQLNTVHIFIPARTQLPAFFYSVLVIGITSLHQLTPALVSSALFIFVFFRIFSSYKNDGISVSFFDCGLLIAVASLIYFPALIFYLFLLAALPIIRSFNWREWVFTLIGLMLPYVFLISIYYLLDLPVSGIFTDIRNSIAHTSWKYDLSTVIYWSFILLIMLITSFYNLSMFDSMKIHARKYFQVFFVFFLFSLLVYLLMSGAGSEMVYFAAVPLSYLFSFYFMKCSKNWINEMFIVVLLLLLIWQRVS
jgi:hypothetical protein